MRLVLVALSAPSDSHQRFRCFQRYALSTLLSSTEFAPGSWLAGRAGNESFDLLFRYVIGTTANRSVSTDLAREQMRFGDLLLVDTEDGPRACAEKIFLGLAWAASPLREASFVGVVDDDAFIHPTRLAHDLLPLVTHPREVLYGQMTWSSGWSNKHGPHRRIGGVDLFANKSRMWQRWRRASARGDAGAGPYVVPYGFCMVLSAGLARRVAALLPKVQSRLRRSAIQRRILRFGRKREPKCTPGGDHTVGWALTHLLAGADGAAPELTLLDTTFGGRMKLWPTPTMASDFLQGRSAVLHMASEWEKHWRIALCSLVPDAETDGESRTEGAPLFTCRGRAPASERCAGGANLRCPARPSQPLKGGGWRECGREPACQAYYDTTFARWSACYVSGQRRVPRVPPPRNLSALCDTSAAHVLQRCAGSSR